MSSRELAPMQSGYVQVRDLNVYHEIQGEGIPLVLIHGGTLTLRMWDEWVPVFAQRFKVITLDSRGHGKTNNPANKLSFQMMADDVAAIIGKMELERPLVCGFSDGGQIALELGMRHPGCARALVIGAAFYKLSETYFNALRGFGMFSPGEVDFDYLDQAMPDAVAFWKTAHVRESEPDYWRRFLQQISSMWWTDLNYTTENFAKVTDPTLVIMGDRDGMIPIDEAFDMYRMLPNAELAILPNESHMTMMRKDGPMIDLVMQYLLRHAAT